MELITGMAVVIFIIYAQTELQRSVVPCSVLSEDED